LRPVDDRARPRANHVSHAEHPQPAAFGPDRAPGPRRYGPGARARRQRARARRERRARRGTADRAAPAGGGPLRMAGSCIGARTRTLLRAAVAAGGAASRRDLDLRRPGACRAARRALPHGGVATIASADVTVKAGRRLFVLVGGLGTTQQAGTPGAGGFDGGASGGALRFGNGFGNYVSGGGGGGGGASDVRTCSVSSRSCDTLASRLIVAAGGGGGGG